MNRLYRNISAACCLSLASLFASCIYQDEVACPCEVRFVYDMNMEFADAFPSQVDDVTLYIFDEEGRFVSSVSDGGPHLDAGYFLPLQLAPGNYQLVAWAGTASAPGCYDLPASPATSVQCGLSLAAEGNKYAANPGNLWHAATTEFTVHPDAPSRTTLSLVKDVKRFRILLQRTDGADVDNDDYSFAITAANRQLAWDNTPGGETLTYLPYVLEETKIENTPDEETRAGGNYLHALVAEMATLRLTPDLGARLTVRNERKQKNLLDIDLVRYLHLMKMDEHADMPLQEFLDRESEYRIILFLGEDSSGQEAMVAIQINAWILVFNDTEL